MLKNLSHPLLAICILIAGLFNLSTGFAEEDIEYRFERLWPQLEQPWYFSSPPSLAIATNGNAHAK